MNPSDDATALPNDVTATPMSESEITLLRKLGRVARQNRSGTGRMYYCVTRNEMNAADVDSLEERKLVILAGLDGNIYLTDAGESALIEAEVANRFKELDTYVISTRRPIHGSSYARDVVREKLIEIVRDQERRLLKLEQRG